MTLLQYLCCSPHEPVTHVCTYTPTPLLEAGTVRWGTSGFPEQFQGERRELLPVFSSKGHISEPQEGRLKRTDLLDNHSWGPGVNLAFVQPPVM